MSIRQLSVVLLTVASTVVMAAPADAAVGDWLFGRNTQPYTANYGPAPQIQMQTYDNRSVYTGQPVVNGYGANRTAYQLPPTGTVAPVSGWTPVNPNQGYSAGYGAQPSLAPTAAQPTPWTVTNTTVGPPVGAPPAVAPTFAAPRLGYPAPFARPNTGGEVPIARALRGANTTSNPFYGTGNMYPNTFGATPQPYASAYGSNQVALQPSLNGPAVDPLFPNAPRPVLGGLSRFFGSLLGTNYQSSYYRAPITYYRPMTAVDPVTGTTVTSQQACSSYVQQLQRTPYNSYQPGGGLLPGGYGNQGTTVTPVGPPMPCGTGGCGLANAAPQPYAPQQYGPNPYAANPSYTPSPDFGRTNPFNDNLYNDGGAVGQVGGTGSPDDRDVIPIPSTDPRSGYYQQNTQPLTGRPRSSVDSGGSDRDDVPQPRLESARPSNDEDTYGDGLWRRDVTPYGDEDPYKKEDVDQSSYYKPKLDDEPLDLNGPLGMNRYRQQQRYAPEPSNARDRSYTQMAPISPRATFRTEQPVSRTDESVKPAAVPPTYSTARPIPDPEPSPFANRDTSIQITQPGLNESSRYESKMQAPKLPPATEPASTDGWYKRGEANSASARITVPVREANLSLKQFQREPIQSKRAPAKSLKPILRDSEGWMPL